MSKRPLPPWVKKKQRDMKAYVAATIAAWSVTLVLVALPFILAAHGLDTESMEMVLVTVFVAIFAIFSIAWAISSMSSAWDQYDHYRYQLDELEWDKYQVE